MTFFEKGELKLLWPFYLESFLPYLIHFAPAFMVIYLIEIGFTLAQIGVLIAVMPLTSLIFEVPTGAIADIYGRKFSVILGYCLEGILVFLIFFTKNYYSLLILFSLVGMAGTLSSGSKEAWIVDFIKKKNKKHLHGFFAKDQFFVTSALIFSGIIGAFFVKLWGLSIIWVFFTLSYIISISILAFIPEVHIERKFKEAQSFKKIFSQSKESVRYSLKHPVIFYLLLAGFFMIISVVFSESLAYVPLLKELNFPDYAFGYFASGMALAGAIAPLFAKKFLKKGKEVNFLIFSTALGSLILLLIYFVNSYIFAIAVILVAIFFYTMKYPVEMPYFHRFVPNKLRATVGSFKSMVYSLAAIISLPIGGYLIELIGPKNTIIISALLGIPSIIAYLMIKEKSN